MSGKLFLLDTNIVIALFVGEANVVTHIENEEGVFIPSIAFGELFCGAELSTRKEQNLKRLQDFSSACTILDCNYETERNYSLVKSFLKKRGNPIPENDIWIAALAIQHHLILATRDNHFDRIKNLKTAKW